MPRALILGFLGLLVLSGATAQGAGLSQPVWTLAGPDRVRPGEPFVVTATVHLPRGYYQDADSTFLVFEARPPAQMTGRSASVPALRAGKASFTETFTLTRTLVLASGTAPGPTTLTFSQGWQICQVDGVCLLPAEKTQTLTLTVEGAPADAPWTGFWPALVGAFLGGLLLNFMPCVFPVLALKGLGLAAAGRTRERRLDALAFAAGSLGSVTALGLAAGVVAAFGQRLEWGFAFQQPAFVWVLILAFWAITLQLWGLWTPSWSAFSLSRPHQPSLGRSVAGGAFLVVAAAPCTAPLLGPALGWALTRPPAEIPVYFFAIGLGLALPLLILQAFPNWAKILPKPGPWMKAVEGIAGAFLAVTVVYLVWVFLSQTGFDRLGPVVGLLVLAGGALMLWTQRHRHRLAVGGAVLGFLLLLGASVALVAGPSRAVATSTSVAGWKTFSPAALDQALAEGRPVLIDATAAWCATCQVNELAVLHRSDVDALLNRLGVEKLRADYTLPDPVILAWLTSVHRAGLPVYALYRPGKPVHLFPELLTDDNFTRALPSLVMP